MGTNYYYRYNICDTCGRYEELHIGKTSAGWKFSFQGYDKTNFIEIKSFQDWKNNFNFGITKNKNQYFGYILDEYGRKYNSEEFIKIVNARKNEPNSHKKRLAFALTELSYWWNDEEGNDFTLQIFC